MRILVTGGRGFLGRVVVGDLLRRGHEVDVLSRGVSGTDVPAGTRLVRVDLRDEKAVGRVLSARSYDGIAHLAAPPDGRTSFVDPLTFIDVIVGGMRNLFRAVAASEGRRPVIVNASTNAVYGSAHSGRLCEDLPTHPESPYAAAKLAAEQVLGSYAADESIAAVTLRIFNVAGAVGGFRDTDPSRILPRVLAAADGGTAVGVNGDGTAVRDFVHGLDVAEAVRLAFGTATAGEHTVLNVGSGQGTSVRDLITAAERITGRPIAVRHHPPTPEPTELVADIARIQQELNWKPRHSTLDTIVRDAWTKAG